MAPPDLVDSHDPTSELLFQLQPQLEELFARFRLPLEVAEDILEDCLLVMTFRYDQLAQPEQWFIRTLRYRCIKYWREQRQNWLEQAEQQIRVWLQEDDTDDSELEMRRQELDALVSEMPKRCRDLLRRYFSLDLPLAERTESDSRLVLGYHQVGPTRCLAALVRKLQAVVDDDLPAS